CYTPDEFIFVQPDKVEIITANTLVRKIGCGDIKEFTFGKSQRNEHILNFARQLDISLKPFSVNAFSKELFILQTDDYDVNKRLNKIQLMAEQFRHRVKIAD